MIVSFDSLSTLPKPCPKSLDPSYPCTCQTFVFCSGSFDLFHAGHVLFLEDCKRFGNILVVGVGSDEAVRANKGSDRPIMNRAIRMKLVDSCRVVDYTVLDDITINPGRVGLMLEIVFNALKPTVYVVNEDAIEMESRRSVCEAMGVTMVVLPRTCPPEYDGISTTKIIERLANRQLDDWELAKIIQKHPALLTGAIADSRERNGSLWNIIKKTLRR